jgi:hypothetical protein
MYVGSQESQAIVFRLMMLGVSFFHSLVSSQLWDGGWACQAQDPLLLSPPLPQLKQTTVLHLCILYYLFLWLLFGTQNLFCFHLPSQHKLKSGLREEVFCITIQDTQQKQFDKEQEVWKKKLYSAIDLWRFDSLHLSSPPKYLSTSNFNPGGSLNRWNKTWHQEDQEGETVSRRRRKMGSSQSYNGEMLKGEGTQKKADFGPD